MTKKPLLKPEKTDEAIFKAFCKIIMLHNLDSITVADIITEAGVHRSTFYAHFEDKYDLAKKFLLHGVVGINNIMQSLVVETPEKKLVALTDFFRLLQNNKEMLYTAIDHIGERITFECCENGTYNVIANIVSPTIMPYGFDREITMQALTGAMVGIIKWWVRTSMSLPPEVVAKQYFDIHTKLLAQ